MSDFFKPGYNPSSRPVPSPESKLHLVKKQRRGDGNESRPDQPRLDSWLNTGGFLASDATRVSSNPANTKTNVVDLTATNSRDQGVANSDRLKTTTAGPKRKGHGQHSASDPLQQYRKPVIFRPHDSDFYRSDQYTFGNSAAGRRGRGDSEYDDVEERGFASNSFYGHQVPHHYRGNEGRHETRRDHDSMTGDDDEPFNPADFFPAASMYDDRITDPGSLDVGYHKKKVAEETIRDEASAPKVAAFNVADFIAKEAKKVEETKKKTPNTAPDRSGGDGSTLGTSLGFDPRHPSNFDDIHAALYGSDSGVPYAKLRDDLIIADRMVAVSVDSLCRLLLQVRLSELLVVPSMEGDEIVSSGSAQTLNDADNFGIIDAAVPIREAPAKIIRSGSRVHFTNEDQYINYFEPLLLDEVRDSIREIIVTTTQQRSNLQQRSGSNRRNDRVRGTSTTSNGENIAVLLRYIGSVPRKLSGPQNSQPSVPGAATYPSSTSSRALSSRNAQPSGVADDSLVEARLSIITDFEGVGNVQDLQKDDLVMIFSDTDGSGRPIDPRQSLKRMATQPHSLGIILSVPLTRSAKKWTKPGESLPSSAEDEDLANSDCVCSILMLKECSERLRPRTSEFRSKSLVYVVHVANLCTFMREWAALHSIRCHELVPLTPYLLKAAPVISSSKLRNMGVELSTRVRALVALHQSLKATKQKVVISKENNLGMSVDGLHSDQRLTEDDPRYRQVAQAIRAVLASLESSPIDAMVLKNSNIVETIRQCKTTLATCDQLLANSMSILLKTWRHTVETGFKMEQVTKRRSGQVIAVPSVQEVHRQCPQGISAELWSSLKRQYNHSQLFAMQHVLGTFQIVGQDTKVMLVQGPPGTGKTSTIIGMISAMLHFNMKSSQVSSGPSTSSKFDPEQRRLLVCAPSNTAIDEILSRLLAQGVLDHNGSTRAVRLVRLGNPKDGASESILQLSLEYKTEESIKSCDLWAKFLKLNESIEELYTKIHDLERKNDARVHVKRSADDYYGPSSSAAVSHTEHLDDTKPTSILRFQLEDSETKGSRELSIRRLRLLLSTKKKDRSLMQAQLDKLRLDIQSNLLFNAEVVAGTLSSSGQQLFLDHIIRDNLRFHTAIVDEAGQASEPSTLIPLRYGCSRLVLVGDPRQLPATVLSNTARDGGLGVSLFERLEKAGHEIVMLTVQYRMHPDIRLFPSNQFYEGKLEDARSISDEIKGISSSGVVTAPYVTHPIDNLGATSKLTSSVADSAGNKWHMGPINFVDYGPRFPEARVGKSYRNDGEAGLVVNIVESMIADIRSSLPLTSLGSSTTTVRIGIISFYQAQVQQLKRLLEPYLHHSVAQSIELVSNGPVQRAEHSPPVILSAAQSSVVDVEVNTVDGFQGREMDIIVVSCVRSHHIPHDRRKDSSTRSSHHHIGFVADERRLNVAITRARKCLVLVGSAETLITDHTWRQLFASLQERQCVRIYE